MTQEEKKKEGDIIAECIADLLRGYQKRCSCKVLAISLRDRRVWLTCEDRESKKKAKRPA